MSDLGTARGRIVIDTSDVKRAQREVQAASRGMTQALNAIGIGVGAREFVQFAVAADQIATAYRRQTVAARNLAGSQSQLNELLRVYDDATGGAVSRAEALANVTKLLSVGFADSAQELDQFARAIRGISIAMGMSQDTVTQNLILELFTQRGARLDQLGLQYEKVKQRADELQAADKSLTDQMAYQQAVLEQANDRFGELADSSAGAATGMEELRKEWDNLMLSFGTTGPIDFVAQAMANWLKQARRDIEFLTNAVQQLEIAFDRLRFAMGFRTSIGAGTFNSAMLESGGSFGRPSRSGGSIVAAPRFSDEQEAAIVEWNEARIDIERQAGEDIAEQTRQYGQERAQTIRNYEKSIAREAEDFGRQRANAERRFAMQLLDIAQDSARQRVRWAEELERSIAQARQDSAERVADLRGDANKRLAELEEDYQRNRERRAEEHRDRLFEAAGRLDARAVLEARKNYTRQERDAKQNYDKQRQDAQEQLQERIEDEQKALDKSIRQQQDAHARQLADQAENDRLRIEEMKRSFEEQKAQEDIERGIRLERMAEDHADQLIEMDRAHGERIKQIGDQAQKERDVLDREFGRSLEELEVHVDGFIKEAERATDAAIKNFDLWLKHVEESFKPPPLPPGVGGESFVPGIPQFASGGFIPRDMLAMLHRGEFVMPAPMVAAATAGGGGGATFTGDVNVNITGSTNMGANELGPLVRMALVEALEEIAA